MADLSVPDSVKMLRETFCVAQTLVGLSGDARAQEHVDRLQRLVDDCDRQRPLGPDGKHGDRHTATCGCEDAPMDDLHEDQGCGYRWNDMIGFLNPGPSRRHLCAKDVHTLSSEHECGCGDTRPNVDPLLDLDPHARQTCGFRWRDEYNATSGSEHQCSMPVHPNLTDWHRCRCDAARPGVVVTRAHLGEA